jgi:hypothetical protein
MMLGGEVLLLTRYSLSGVQIAEKPHGSSAMQEAISARLKLQICRTGARHIRVEIDAVCDFRHQRFRQPRGKPVVVVFDHGAISVAARVRGVVVGPVIVHSPIHELQAAVGAVRIHVEEIDYVEFSEAKLDSASRQ